MGEHDDDTAPAGKAGKGKTAADGVAEATPVPDAPAAKPAVTSAPAPIAPVATVATVATVAPPTPAAPTPIAPVATLPPPPLPPAPVAPPAPIAAIVEPPAPAEAPMAAVVDPRLVRQLVLENHRADEAEPPPGPAPRGNIRSFRREGDAGALEFVLIYAKNTFLIKRIGIVGRRGRWELVEYPGSGMASFAYARECSDLTSRGFRDVQ